MCFHVCRTALHSLAWSESHLFEMAPILWKIRH